MTACIVYMTATDRSEALRIGHALVEERLAACVNLLGEITSLYRWDGAVQQAGEVAFIAKTTAEKVAALTKRVEALHSYETPCVVAVPVTGGSALFLEWVAGEVTGACGPPAV